MQVSRKRNWKKYHCPAPAARVRAGRLGPAKASAQLPPLRPAAGVSLAARPRRSAGAPGAAAAGAGGSRNGQVADQLAVLQRRADGPPGPGVQHGRQLSEVAQQQELHVGVQPHARQVRPERHVQLRDLFHNQPWRSSAEANRNPPNTCKQASCAGAMMSCLDSAGRPRRRGGRTRGAALVEARLRKERVPPRCPRTLRSEAGGARKLRPSSASWLALEVPLSFRSATAAFVSRWSAFLSFACPLRLSCPSPSLSSLVGLALAALGPTSASSLRTRLAHRPSSPVFRDDSWPPAPALVPAHATPQLCLCPGARESSISTCLTAWQDAKKVWTQKNTRPTDSLKETRKEEWQKQNQGVIRQTNLLLTNPHLHR